MYERYGKRTLDITLATIAIIVFAVPMIIVAVWVKIDSKGPALFKQLRFGKNQKHFRVYKFRTMTVEAPADMPTNAFKDAGAHITRSGRIMRKLSLDELPQLFNVLNGTMSIIGPRPVILKEVVLIEMREQVGANSVKPGITGWAQVNGRDALNDAMKSRLDGEYVRNMSFKMDMKCFAMTVWAVASVKGHREGHELADNNGEEEVILDSHMATDEG